MISLGDASSLNSAVYKGPGAPLPEDWEEEDFVVDRETGLTMGHYSNGYRNYLAIRGTWNTSDVLPALRVFFGADPLERIQVAQGYIKERFGDRPNPATLAVGGHSLGGLVAAAMAEEFQLPGLAQNAPGWMTRTPSPDRLQGFLQIRTARDVVADWGSVYPRSLMLTDPGLPRWGITSLHNLEHQNRLIQEHGLADRGVDNPALGRMKNEIPELPPTHLQRLGRAMDRWRTAHELTHLHGRLAGPDKPTPRMPTP